MMRELVAPNNTDFVVDECMRIKIHLAPYDITTNPLLLSPGHKDGITILITGEEDRTNTDCLITTNKELELGIQKVRDCAPICLCDGTTLALVHVGWKGFSLSLIEKALAYFDPEKVRAYVGPHLHSFEIQKDQCYEQLLAKKEGGVAEHITDTDGVLTFHFRDALASVLPEQTVFDARNTQYAQELASFRFKHDMVGYLISVRFA